MTIDRKIVRVGNSQGIVLPKSVLKLAGIDTLFLTLKIADQKLVLTPKNKKQFYSKPHSM